MKAPFSWPNRIELDKIGRDRAAIDGDEGLAGARARGADRAGEQFLAHARFAFDQNGDFGSRRLFGELERGLHSGARGREIGKGDGALGGALHAAHLAGERRLGERVSHRDLQPLGSDGLDDEVDGARAHGGDHRVDRALRRQHDHGRVDATLPQAAENAEAVEIGHDEIEDRAGDPRAFRAFQQAHGLLAALHHLRLVAEAAKHGVDQAALDRIVVDNEYARGHNPSRRAKPAP